MSTLDRKFVQNLKKYGKTIKVNGIDEVGFFKEIEDKNGDDSKYLFTDLDIVKQGDYIEALGGKWLAISKANNINDTYDKTVIKRVEYTIKFNNSGTIRSFPAIIDTKVMDIDSGTFISVPAGKIKVTIQNSADAINIALTSRFINTGRAWKVTGIDKSKIGLIVLSCDLDLISDTYDDLTNEIPDRWRYETTHTYVLTIGNGSEMEAPLNDFAQLNISVTDNGTIMNTLPPLTFLTSDSNVVSVDNTGKLIGINVGVATVTCKMTYKTLVLDTITITVVENVNHVITMSVTGSATIPINTSKSYVAHFYDNGIEIFNKTATWTVRNQDGTTAVAYANITSQTGNGCTIKAHSSSSYINKYVILKATLTEDANVFAEITVKLMSLV